VEIHFLSSSRTAFESAEVNGPDALSKVSRAHRVGGHLEHANPLLPLPVILPAFLWALGALSLVSWRFDCPVLVLRVLNVDNW
jgi:hypothetical protein